MSFYIYLSVSIASGMGLCFFIMILINYVKYRREKNLRKVVGSLELTELLSEGKRRANIVIELEGSPDDS